MPQDPMDDRGVRRFASAANESSVTRVTRISRATPAAPRLIPPRAMRDAAHQPPAIALVSSSNDNGPLASSSSTTVSIGESPAPAVRYPSTVWIG